MSIIQPVLKTGIPVVKTTAKIVAGLFAGFAISSATIYVAEGIQHSVDDIKASRSARRAAKATYYARRREHNAKIERELGSLAAAYCARNRPDLLHGDTEVDKLLRRAFIDAEIQRQIDAGLLVKVTPATVPA